MLLALLHEREKSIVFARAHSNTIGKRIHGYTYGTTEHEISKWTNKHAKLDLDPATLLLYSENISESLKSLKPSKETAR